MIVSGHGSAARSCVSKAIASSRAATLSTAICRIGWPAIASPVSSTTRANDLLLVRTFSSRSSLPSRMVTMGLTLSRLPKPAATCPTRPLIARYFSVENAPNRWDLSPTARAAATTSATLAPACAASAAARTMNPCAIETTRVSTTSMVRSGSISFAVTAAP